MSKSMERGDHETQVDNRLFSGINCWKLTLIRLTIDSSVADWLFVPNYSSASVKSQSVFNNRRQRQFFIMLTKRFIVRDIQTSPSFDFYITFSFRKHFVWKIIKRRPPILRSHTSKLLLCSKSFGQIINQLPLTLK